jgi:DNA polymerase family B
VAAPSACAICSISVPVLQVIYGDTDSIMVNTRTRDHEACKKLADTIMRQVDLVSMHYSPDLTASRGRANVPVVDAARLQLRCICLSLYLSALQTDRAGKGRP